MTAHHFRTASGRCSAWLLWLALLMLPIAPVAANGHRLSHLTATGTEDHGQRGDKPTLHQTPCHACVAAAALGGSAPPPAGFLGRADRATRHEPLHRSTESVRTAWREPVYRSRAPPPASP